MDLHNIPAEEFPLNYTRYNNLMDEIRSAARGFSKLQDQGWPRAKEIDLKLMDIHHSLNQVWNLIQETERELLARKTGNDELE